MTPERKYSLVHGIYPAGATVTERVEWNIERLALLNRLKHRTAAQNISLELTERRLSLLHPYRELAAIWDAENTHAL